MWVLVVNIPPTRVPVSVLVFRLRVDGVGFGFGCGMLEVGRGTWEVVGLIEIDCGSRDPD